MSSDRWRRASASGLTLRPVVESDLPFLHRVYASTRADELALTAWTDEQKVAFVAQQFHAQHTDYQKHYPDADRLVILADANPAGRLYLERGSSELLVIDIALLPEFRRDGFGTAIMSDVIDAAAERGKAVSIHVEKFNVAMRLYLRLGFVKVEDHGVYDLMRWTPDPTRARS